MPQQTRTIQIFVGSPGDVSEERERAFEIIERLNNDPLLPDGWRAESVGWDRTPYASTTWLSPQKAIDGNLLRPSACDIAVFALWSRIGTPLSEADYPPDIRPEGLDRAPTGTEWEFFDAMGAGEETGKPVVLTFRCSSKQQIDTDDEAEEDRLIWQRREVRRFFKHFQDDQGRHRWGYPDYSSPDDFADKLNGKLRDSIKTLIETESGKKPKGKQPPKPKGPAVPSEYLRWLREEDTRIPLLGLDPKKPNKARLPEVYVPALTQSRSLLLDRLNTESLYIPGAPGAGKSVFCRWLSARLGFSVRLPMEMEWQQAASGGDAANVWPWGDKYRSGFANIDEGRGHAGPYRIRETTPVGLYIKGASVQGALDLSGNVWEWCLNKRNNPADLSPGGEDRRSLRGGSWDDDLDYARAAYRYFFHPRDRGDVIGFRVCCVSHIIHGSFSAGWRFRPAGRDRPRAGQVSRNVRRPRLADRGHGAIDGAGESRPHGLAPSGIKQTGAPPVPGPEALLPFLVPKVPCGNADRTAVHLHHTNCRSDRAQRCPTCL